MVTRQNVSRRQFLRGVAGTAAGIVAFAHVIRASALGKNGNIAPSERIAMGCIGVGSQGGSNMKQFLGEKDCRIVAVCDVGENTLQRAVSTVNKKYASQDCAPYTDFRDLLARKDINAVVISTPDHWHAVTVIESCKAGKDVYCEKPLSQTIAEARAMVNAVRKRSDPICTIEIGAGSVTVCHLGNIAYRLQRPLKWDPKREAFIGDDEANRLLTRAMRNPWQI